MDKNIKVLEHEILKTLKRVGMTITSRGSEVNGHTPLDVRMLETSNLHYGTLVALLNDPNFKPKEGQPTFLNQVKVTKEEVGNNLLYNWSEVAEALEILESNGDIANEVTGAWMDVEDRRIKLTATGLKSFNSKFYLKEYIKERETKQLARSTVWTNRVIVITAILTVVLSSYTALLTYWDRNNKESVSKKEINELIQAVQQLKQIDTIRITDTVGSIQQPKK